MGNTSNTDSLITTWIYIRGDKLYEVTYPINTKFSILMDQLFEHLQHKNRYNNYYATYNGNSIDWSAPIKDLKTSKELPVILIDSRKYRSPPVPL